MNESVAESGLSKSISGFWRRIGALAIDTFVLGLAGMIVGVVLFDPLARMGGYERLIGFAIAWAYFGILNSSLGGGQTLGKRMLDLRVVDADGQWLSLPRSLVRYGVLGLPFFLNGLPISPDLATSLVGDFLALVVFGGLFAIVYLYVFNRRTRQSLHDLAVGSFVVRAGSAPLPSPGPGPRSFPAIWRGHLAVVAIAALMAFGAPAVLARWLGQSPFRDLLAMMNDLAGQPHVLHASVARGWTSSSRGETHYLQSQLRLDAPLVDDEEMAKRFAQHMLKMDTAGDKDEAITVSLIYGYDMVIASGWHRHAFSFKRDELQ